MGGIVSITPAPLPAVAQASPGEGAGAEPIPRLERLPNHPFTTMSMKLEKTIFAIDVLTLTLRVDPATAGRIESVLAGAEELDDTLEARVAELAVRAPEAVAEIEFLRDVGLGRFLGEVDGDMRKAMEAGWLDAEGYRRVREGLPEWFSFLAERGIRKGDRLSYHVRGDTLRTVFWIPSGDPASSGEVLLDQTDVGEANVRALLGAYFAPGSSFREKLVQSLLSPVKS